MNYRDFSKERKELERKLERRECRLQEGSLYPEVEKAVQNDIYRLRDELVKLNLQEPLFATEYESKLPVKAKEGVKHDQAKPRFSLLPLKAIQAVVSVLEFGAQKYAVDNWKKVPEARTRYYDATHRHIAAWWLGEKKDPETGLPHLAHAVCCLLFLIWFDDKEEANAEVHKPD